MTSEIIRCDWAASPLLISYHDHEWGVPLHDDRRLFEMLILEGAQAGLSWEIILRKRPSYRAAFADFDPAAVAEWDEPDVERLMGDSGIVRNRLEIQSAILNARATLRGQEEFGSWTRSFGDLWTGSLGKTILRASRKFPVDLPNPRR